MEHGADNLQGFLDRLTDRSVLHDNEKAAILDLPTRVAQVEIHRDFVSLGETTDHVCLVVDGIVGRFGQNATGGRQITALHIAGDMADLHSVVQPRAGSALQALTPTTLLRVPHAALREVAARYPAVAEALWRDCAVDAAILAQWVTNVGRRSARTRLAHLLCEIATRYRAEGQREASSFAFAATQSQLADATGMTTVHVNRTLKSLQGIASLSNRTIDIQDWDALSDIGEFDAGYLQVDIKPADRIRIAAPA